MKPSRSILQAPASIPYICSNCLRSRHPRPSSIINRKQRTFCTQPSAYSRRASNRSSTLKFPSASRSLSTVPPSKGYARLPSRRLLSLSGPDSTHFLQGAITANIESATANPNLNTGFYTAFLNAQGRVLNDVFIYRDHSLGEGKEGWLVEVDANEVEALRKHLRRYKLRAKFEMRVVDEGEMGVWNIWGERKEWTASTLGSNDGDSTARSEIGKGEIGCLDSRAPGMGRRLILLGIKKPEVEMEESGEDAYRIRRYLMGVPEGQGEIIKEKAFPQESSIDFMGGIDYRKGCYVGQELTIRTHHTGVVRKRILPVMFYGVEEEEPTSLEYQPGKDYGVERVLTLTAISGYKTRVRSPGKFIAGVGNVGLGLCNLEAMTDVRNDKVQVEPGAATEGKQFMMTWEPEEGKSGLVKVKAFLPPWHTRKV